MSAENIFEDPTQAQIRRSEEEDPIQAQIRRSESDAADVAVENDKDDIMTIFYDDSTEEWKASYDYEERTPVNTSPKHDDFTEEWKASYDERSLHYSEAVNHLRENTPIPTETEQEEPDEFIPESNLWPRVIPGNEAIPFITDEPIPETKKLSMLEGLLKSIYPQIELDKSALEQIKKIINDIGAPFIRNPAKEVLAGGVRDGIQGLFDIANEADIVLGGTGFDYELPEIESVDEPVAHLVRAMTQFFAGFGAAGGLRNGVSFTRQMLAGAGADATFDPELGNLSTLLREQFNVDNVLVNYLDSKVGEDADALERLESRAKMILEGGGIGGLIPATMAAWRSIKHGGPGAIQAIKDLIAGRPDQKQYQWLVAKLGGEKQASEYLASKGRSGVKELAAEEARINVLKQGGVPGHLPGVPGPSQYPPTGYFQAIHDLVNEFPNAARAGHLTHQTGMVSWHGTGHKWESGVPDLSKVGTGQGAQTYGHGVYFAENRKVAKSYSPRDFERSNKLWRKYHQAKAVGDYNRMELWERAITGNQRMRHDTPDEIRARSLDMDYDEDYRRVAAEVADELEAMPSSSHLYKVDIPDADIDRMLDWDKPLSEQPESVQRIALKTLSELDEDDLGYGLTHAGAGDMDLPDELMTNQANITGRQFYRIMEYVNGGQAEASFGLADIGIPGIKYLDQQSRVIGSGGTVNDTAKNILDAAGGDYKKAVKIADERIAVATMAPDDPRTNIYAARKLLAEGKVDEGTRNFVIFDEELLNRINVLDGDGKPTHQLLDNFTNEVKVALSEISDSQLQKVASEGYDLSTIWYHGTPSPDGITSLIEKGNIKSLLYDIGPEPGFWITRDPAMAADYAGHNGVIEKMVIKYDSGRYYDNIPGQPESARTKENIVEFGLLDNDYSGKPTLISSDAFIPFDLVDDSVLFVKGNKLFKPEPKVGGKVGIKGLDPRPVAPKSAGLPDMEPMTSERELYQSVTDGKVTADDFFIGKTLTELEQRMHDAIEQRIKDVSEGKTITVRKKKKGKMVESEKKLTLPTSITAFREIAHTLAGEIIDGKKMSKAALTKQVDEMFNPDKQRLMMPQEPRAAELKHLVHANGEKVQAERAKILSSVYGDNAPVKGMRPEGTVSFPDIKRAIRATIQSGAVDLKTAKKVLEETYGIKNLMKSNLKMKKAQVGYKQHGVNKAKEPLLMPDDRGVETTGLSLYHAYKEAKISICALYFSCADKCIAWTSGGNWAYGGGADRYAMKGPRRAHFMQNQALIRDPEVFIAKLDDEVGKAWAAAQKNGNQLGIRLNVLSDVPPTVYEDLMRKYPDVQFYDYTKLHSNKPIAPNHHLTYSSTGTSNPGLGVINLHQNWKHMTKKLGEGYNVAMPFTVGANESLPKFVKDMKSGKTYKVIDGDVHDYRPADDWGKPEGADGYIVGLRNKDQNLSGASRKEQAVESKGFITYYDPAKGDTAEIAAQSAKGAKGAGDMSKVVLPSAVFLMQFPHWGEYNPELAAELEQGT